MTRILIVHDEPQLVRALVLNLRNRGYDTATATTGKNAIEQVANPAARRRGPRPACPIATAWLSSASCVAASRRYPSWCCRRARGAAAKVAALDLVAVDYVTKPFDMNELIARLRAAYRRAGSGAASNAVSVGANTIDLVARTARRDDGSPLHLTPTEWRVLDVMLSHPGQLISARDLPTAISRDPDHTESSYLRIYLAQLRRKLEPIPNRPRHLLTEPGMGYRFQP